MRIYQLLLTLIIVIASSVAQSADKPHTIDQINQIANDFLLEQTGDYPGQAIITIETPKIGNDAECNNLQAELSGTIRSNTTVRIRCLGPETWLLYVKANIQIIGTYYVAKRLIQRDEIIGYDDIEERQADLLKMRRAITDPDNLIGWISARRIPAGSVIDSNALRDPNSIQRGQQVRTIARGIGFVATGSGQALSSGTPGTQVQVRTAGGQIITGTVVDSQTVQVIM